MKSLFWFKRFQAFIILFLMFFFVSFSIHTLNINQHQTSIQSTTIELEKQRWDDQSHQWLQQKSEEENRMNDKNWQQVWRERQKQEQKRVQQKIEDQKLEQKRIAERVLQKQLLEEHKYNVWRQQSNYTKQTN